jgi:hypothetical protein
MLPYCWVFLPLERALRFIPVAPQIYRRSVGNLLRPAPNVAPGCGEKKRLTRGGIRK